MGIFGKKQEAVPEELPALEHPIIARGRPKKFVGTELQQPQEVPQQPQMYYHQTQPSQPTQPQVPNEIQQTWEFVQQNSIFRPSDGMTLGEATICNLLFTLLVSQQSR